MNLRSSSSKSIKRVPKAAPKSGRKRRQRQPVPVTADLLRSTPFFANLPKDYLDALVPRAEHVELARGDDAFNARPVGGQDMALFLVLFGDLSVHRTQNKGPEETVNYLTVGDFFVERLIVDDDTKSIRLTAMCPVRLLKVSYADFNVLLRAHDDLRGAFSDRIRDVVDRQKSRFDDAFQKEIARFLVQERLTFAGRVKLKRMDLCIECDGCYSACKDRHGTDRLGPSEVKYGLTEVPQNCHNCVVPECMDKCKFGHIGRHAVTGEIVIDDNCIGCTMCSKGCSFGSIRMHPIAELDMEKYFPNRSPDAKGKAIAQKCDNCTGYEDKACISACPTGALFQLDGAELFDNWRQFSPQSVPDGDAIESPNEFPHGWRQFWVALTVFVTVFLSWECFGRLYWPKVTFAELFFQLGWSESGVDPVVPFRAGDFFSHALGYIGGGLMIGTQVYRLRGRFSTTPVLMEAHIWMGVIGFIMAFFHTAFVFSDPIAVATFLTMFLAVLTGTIGRYVVYIVPRNKHGHELLLDEVNDRIGDVTRQIEGVFSDPSVGHTAIVRLKDIMGQEKSERALVSTESRGWRPFIALLVDLIRRDALTKKRVSDLASELSHGLEDDNQSAQVETLMTEKSRLERAIMQHAFLSKVLKRYRIVHVTSSNIMFGALVLHIVFALMYQVN
ncbi:MAG: hypothetical protein CMH52_00990 [Myxococcales bacterium]|nr:hypothetical protein [Myxococcales bacterium]